MSSDRLIHLRNGVYQGKQAGFAAIYLSQERAFLCSTALRHFSPHGHCLFYSGHAQYMYGQFNNGRAHGVNAVRIADTLYFAKFTGGVIAKGTNVLVFFERYNIGIILETLGDVARGEKAENSSEFRLVEKREVYSSEELEDMALKCGYEEDITGCMSLIKFIGSKLVSQQVKIRIVNQKYYRFGFPKGLAIIFDDSYQRISVGVHQHSQLAGIGAKFTGQALKGIVEEGIFPEPDQQQEEEEQARKERTIYNKQTVLTKNSLNAKIGQLYTKHHLSSVDFVDEFGVDWSKSYINYFKNLTEGYQLRHFVAGCIASPQRNKRSSPQSDDSLERVNRNRTLSFENKVESDLLKDGDRLNFIKQDIYDSIREKSKRSRQMFPEQANKQIRPQMRAQMSESFVKRLRQTPEKEPERAVTREVTPEGTPERSKSRRLIFKEGYSPEAHRKVSPFTKKVRAKIFNERDASKFEEQVLPITLKPDSDQGGKMQAGPAEHACLAPKYRESDLRVMSRRNQVYLEGKNFSYQPIVTKDANKERKSIGLSPPLNTQKYMRPVEYAPIPKRRFIYQLS